mmetsp:Transcript_36526/g.44057  ORF Transcript_36526/g.44057 Transcript_36526/m.44057 type:complete len:392 (-) Transcript_36526:1685-2860(-)
MRKDAKQNADFELLAPNSSNVLEIESEEHDSSSSNGKKKVILGIIGLAVILFITSVHTIDSTVEVEKKVKQKSPHTGDTYGGINNVGHAGGAWAAAQGKGIVISKKGDDDDKNLVSFPVNKIVKHAPAITSLNPSNLVNLWGHYFHDEHRSPYASHLYDQNKTFLEEQQQKFEIKMQKVREEYGAWDFNTDFDDDGDQSSPRVGADFSNVNYRDLPADEFPISSWQSDKVYVEKFLSEAKQLVHRMKEGIYAEYGWPSKKKDGTIMSEEELNKREEAWKIHILQPEEYETKKTIGIATLSQVALDGLVRKLLHAMITTDEFYVVLGGHSAAAGHGNDFQQNRVITFHQIMEPVFNKLGMRLVSRNMGMGGVGTLHFSLAGKDLYGETDILE